MAHSPTLTADQLLRGWTPRRIGRRLLILAETASTNTVALEAAGEPDADGLAVLADLQTAGRGRLGNTWESPRAASVLCSFLVLHDGASGTPAPAGAAGTHLIAGRLTLLSAVAACEAIRAATDVTPAIKWPNDVRAGGRKLGGILIESRGLGADRRAWVVGIGINCLQQAGHFAPELAAAATSLDMIASHPIDRAGVARELLRRLDDWLGGDRWRDDDAIHRAWMSFAEPIGTRVRVRCQGQEHEGRTIDVDPAGGLIIQTDGGRREWLDPLLTTML